MKQELQNGKYNKAECMRRLKVEGKQFTVEWYNLDTDELENKQKRTVAHIQGNAIGFVKDHVDQNDEKFKTVKANPHGNASWLWFDGKNQKYFAHDDGSVTTAWFDENNIHLYKDELDATRLGMKYTPVEKG